jgi:hypothetical protein
MSRRVEYVRRYEASHGRYTADRDADPLVRSVRLPGPDFEAGLILTLYGKTLRWGQGWWIDHPSGTLTAEKKAIARQLQEQLGRLQFFEGYWITATVRLLTVVALVWLCLTGRWVRHAGTTDASIPVTELQPLN